MQLKSINRYKRLERGLKKRFIKPIKHRLKCELAGCCRNILGRFGKTCFIGITGSCGKTTTTELIAAILAPQGAVLKGSHENTTIYVAETILSVTRRHRFCVSEVSAGIPGQIKKIVRLLKPHIGVVTQIGQDHYSQYRSPEATAAEKGKLVESLAVDGTAVLNADDPHVYEMRNRTKAKVITYGFSSVARVRGECVSCRWPQTMSLDICLDQKRFHLQTQLLGEHWAYAVLAAFSVAVAAGVPLDCAVQAIEAFEPIPYRMCPHIMPDGVTFICDNWKSALWMTPAAFDFMKNAKAERKIAVIGSISDTPKSFYRRYKTIMDQSLEAVEVLLFVGEHARCTLRTPGLNGERVMAFDTLNQLDCFLKDYLKAGDLVLLKGTEDIDHLQRIVYSRGSRIACWKDNCRKHVFCGECRDLYAEPCREEPCLFPV